MRNTAIYKVAINMFRINVPVNRFYTQTDCENSVGSWCFCKKVIATPETIQTAVAQAYNDYCDEENKYYESEGWV